MSKRCVSEIQWSMQAGGVTNQDSLDLGWKAEYECMAEKIRNAVENIGPATQDPWLSRQPRINVGW